MKLLGCEKTVQASFQKHVFKLRETKEAREEELEGGWYLEEKLTSELKLSK